MKTSQIILLGLALFLAVQSSAGNPHRVNCGLGTGIDACGCTGGVVKAARLSRPVTFADPYVIKEHVAIKSEPVRGGCGSLHPHRRISGPSVTDLLKHHGGPIAPRFQPVGDLCTTCKKTIAEVVPAYPGKPVCNSCAQKAIQHECGCADPQHFSQSHSNHGGYTSLSSSNTDLNAFEDECLSFDEQESIYNGQPEPANVPADPVSLSLVYGLARQPTRNVPEAAMNFGPKTTPIDGRSRTAVSDIQEEKLFTVEKPVVELKLSHKSVASATYDEIVAQQEALEQQRLELEAQAKSDSGNKYSFISYSDLGYGPVTLNSNKFVSTVSNHESVTADQADDDDIPCGPIGKPIPGYVSGNVIVRSEGDAQESESDYYGEGSYEQDSSYEQDYDQYGSNSSEESEPCDGNSGLLGRLRASARAQSRCGCSRS